MKIIQRGLIFFFLCTVAIILSSCSSTKFIKNPGYDYSRLQKIAVFPLTGDNAYGKDLADEIGQYLTKSGYSVIDGDKVSKELSDQFGTTARDLNNDQIIRVGKSLGVDAAIIGSLETRTEYLTDPCMGFRVARVFNSVSSARIHIIDVRTGTAIGDVSFENGKTLIVFKGLHGTARTIGRNIISLIRSKN